jgi:hypothetical protein
MSDNAVVDGSSIRPTRYNGKSIFSAWKFKTLAYLQSLGLKEVVVADPGLYNQTEAETKTLTGVAAAAAAASGSDGVSSSSSSGKKNALMLKQKSEKAYSILLNLLEDQLIDLVVNVEPGDAYRVWMVLLETFEVKSTASLCHRLDLLMSIRFDTEKETFDVFKGRFMKLLLELKERGETISPAIQRYVLLRAMPSRFESLVQSLKINDSITIEEVYTHIKDYWESDMRRHRSGSKKETAAEGSIAAFLSRKKCYECGSREHLIRHCPKREEGSDSNSEPSSSSDSDGANEEKRKKIKKSKKKSKHVTL